MGSTNTRTRKSGALRVALAQIEPLLGDVRGNIRAHLRAARRAARLGARLLVFPELSLTGYRLQDLVAEVAIRADDPVLRPLLAASRRIALVVGLVEESERHRYHNSALLLHGGRIVHVHRKLYLPDYGLFEEGRYFAAGDGLRAFTTPLGRMGILICEDLWHPSTALILAQDGADYLLVLSNSPTQGIGSTEGFLNQSTWRDLLKVTSQLQTTYVVWVNRVGFEDGVNFGGGSCVVDPSGRIAAQAALFEEDLLVCDLDRSALRRARTFFPLLRDERLPLLAVEVERLLGRGTRPTGRRRP
ncbi:MAG TPA: nitrilase-related carbon-nitrogen hydrolase [Candidatus Polarisedimenticolia bacterium]|nr:nitrilase-related carbon-nitrogen hydrolase [Candidatus Polarisedimenticolia bacterium]